MSPSPIQIDDIEDAAALTAYLRQRGCAGADERLTITNLAGGVSNRTVLSATRADGQAWVLKQALAKLRVQIDWFSDPARIEREALGMQWLFKLAPIGAITRLVFEDPANHVLAMEAVPQPHENWKTQLLTGVIRRDAFVQFGRLLGTIHRNAAARQEELRRLFDDRSFFQSLRLEPYYAFSAHQAPQAAGFLKDLIDNTLNRRLTLVHGDYSPKNILIHQNKLVLLDHEVIHFGDPAFDVGFGMTHFLSKARHLPGHRAALLAGAIDFWTAYRESLGDVPWRNDLERWCVRHTLGCLLARVAGRSPLEYFHANHRRAQRQRVIALMAHPPATLVELAEAVLS